MSQTEKPLIINEELIEQLVQQGATAQQLFGPEGLIDQLKKRLAEKVLNAEMEQHLAEERAALGEQESPSNHRNGYSSKTVLTETSKLNLSIPRDRAGTFEPKLIAKYRRRLPGFDDKVLSMYARGMSTREIQGHLMELYGVEVGPDLISTVTDAVMQEVSEWQSRPLESLYPVVFFDCLRVKIRDEGTVKNKAIYLALGVLPDGRKDVLGMWVEQTEGAKFWLRVMTELKARGLQDILIAVVDGLKGFPEAITAVFPQTQVQTCIVHVIRYCLHLVSWKEQKHVIRDLKRIYQADTEALAALALDEFEQGEWGQKYPSIVSTFRRNREHIIPFFAYPKEVRKIIYTTNAIESLHMRLRKIIKTRGHFPNDEAAIKLLYLALRNITKEWRMSAREWSQAKAHFAILYPERFIPEISFK